MTFIFASKAVGWEIGRQFQPQGPMPAMIRAAPQVPRLRIYDAFLMGVYLGSATDSGSCGSSVSVSTSISFPIPVIVVLWLSYNYISWFAQYLSSLFLNVLVVDAVMTESGRQFHVLTILNANEFFLISVRALWGNIFKLLPRIPVLDVMSFHSLTKTAASLSYFPLSIL